MKNKEVIEKIKKLFAVAHNEGASDAEAQVAMLKAQRLMVKYNIVIEYSDNEEIVYERVSCATPGNNLLIYNSTPPMQLQGQFAEN